MCESHVSNPQTVGKCCSLLNSLLPPSPLPSAPPSLTLILLGRSPGEHPAPPQTLCGCVCMQVCVRVSACLRSTQEVSKERLPAELRLELPLPADSFYANPKSSTTHTRTHSHTQHPPQLPVRNNQDSPRRREAARSLALSLSLFPVHLFLLNTNNDIFSLCVRRRRCVSDPALRLHTELLASEPDNGFK